MKKLLMAVITASLFTSCAMIGNNYGYTYEIVNQDTTSSDLTFEDAFINASFSINRYDISFRLDNKTNQTIKIIWDETVFIRSNNPQRIIHNGVNCGAKNQLQLPTVIPAYTFIQEKIIPTNNNYWEEDIEENDYHGNCERRELLPKNDYGSKKRSAAIYSFEGQTISIYMPIEIDGKKQDYTFTFKITDVNKVTYK